jgi:hypothetical protein
MERKILILISVFLLVIPPGWARRRNISVPAPQQGGTGMSSGEIANTNVSTLNNIGMSDLQSLGLTQTPQSPVPPNANVNNSLIQEPPAGQTNPSSPATPLGWEWNNNNFTMIEAPVGQSIPSSSVSPLGSEWNNNNFRMMETPEGQTSVPTTPQGSNGYANYSSLGELSSGQSTLSDNSMNSSVTNTNLPEFATNSGALRGAMGAAAFKERKKGEEGHENVATPTEQESVTGAYDTPSNYALVSQPGLYEPTGYVNDSSEFTSENDLIDNPDGRFLRSLVGASQDSQPPQEASLGDQYRAQEEAQSMAAHSEDMIPISSEDSELLRSLGGQVTDVNGTFYARTGDMKSLSSYRRLASGRVEGLRDFVFNAEPAGPAPMAFRHPFLGTSGFNSDDDDETSQISLDDYLFLLKLRGDI